ncbi:MAG TPA: non-homologous end-joining DNA ligase [Kofleriaceae bacterium]|nr:non-homologous end-joining DNA ligase [Kofleriaceae bacterium]
MRYEPQLATLVAEAPAGDDWLHEIKYDGYRIGCVVRRGRAELLSRNGKDWTDRFAPVSEAVAALPVTTALLDGEVAVLLPDGRTSFQALQNALGGRSGAQLVYFAFDLHELDGVDLRRRPLEERKASLRELLSGGPKPIVRYSDHVIGQGPRFFAEARRTGLEGIIAKRRADLHRPGRTTGWLKVKCVARQEMVIGGFTEPEGSRTGLGALLLGVHEGDALVYSGKVGTGFTQASARALRQRLDRIERDECPFEPRPAARLVGKGAHWVEPSLVAEVAFIEWTADGRIRHPSFQGMREDRAPGDVRRETPRLETPAGPGPRRKK